jgi:PAS domain S-box-containing protein
MRHVLFGLTWLFLFCASLSPLLAEGFNWRNFNYDNGLPNNNVMDIEQDALGYLWIATTSGLVRFDGKSYEIFDAEDGLQSNSTRRLAITEDQMWIGTPLRGVSTLSGDIWTDIGTEQGLSGSNITAIKNDSRNNIWIGCWNKGLVKYTDGKLFTYTKQDGLSDNRISNIIEDTDGNVWFATAFGLTRFDGRAFSKYFSHVNIQNNHNNWALSLTQDAQSVIWVGTHVGLYQVVDSELNQDHVPLELLFPDISISALAVDSSQCLWIGTLTGLVYSYHQGELLQHHITESDAETAIRDIFIDDENNVWIGTEGQGLFLLRTKGIQRYTTADGFKNNNILEMTSDADKGLFVSDFRGGIFQYNGTDFSSVAIKGNELPYAVSILSDSKKRLWFGTMQGEIHAIDGTHVTTYQMPGISRTDRAISLLEDSRGRIWIGRAHGISYIEQGRITHFTTQDGVPTIGVVTMEEDALGRIWFGCRGSGGILVYDGAEIKPFIETDGLDLNHVFTLERDSLGVMWIGSNAGVSRWDGTDFYHYTSADGIIDNYCTGIAHGAKGTLIGTDKYVLRWEPTEGNFQPVFQIQTNEIRNLNPRGMYADNNGFYWLATKQGLYRIHPDIIDGDVPIPRTYIAKLEVNNQPRDLSDTSQFDYTRNRFEYRFSSISFADPAHLTYRYKLDGFEDTWHITQNSVTAYAALPSGAFTLQLQSQFSGGKWSEPSVTHAFIIASPFWRTWWFYGAAIISTVLLLRIGYRERTRHHIKRTERLEVAVQQRTTDLHNKTHMLELSERRFRDIAETTVGWIWEVDTKGHYTYVSENVVNVLGYQPTDLLGKTPFDFMMPGEQETVQQEFDNLVKDKLPITNLENWNLHKDNYLVCLLTNGVPILDDKKQLCGYRGVDMDITSHIRNEEKLRYTEEMFREIVSHAPAVVFMIDKTGRFQLSEGKGLTALGLKSGELVGQSVYKLYGDNPEVIAGINSALEGQFNSRILKLGDAYFDVFNSPHRDTDGIIDGIIGMAIDVSKRKQMENEHKLLQEQLLQIQKLESIGRLAGGVAHDFNNLLGIIIGNTELMKRKYNLDEQAQLDLQEIHRAARRGTSLTTQLLAFSRKQVLKRESLDFHHHVRATQKMARRLMREDIELQLQLSARYSQINFDPSQLDQVLFNLITNAVDAMPGGGLLTIKTTDCAWDDSMEQLFPELNPGTYLRIDVTDTGSGMPSDLVKQIFDPFFTTKEMGRGTGLGLSTVYGIVKQHGGEIIVESKVTAGSTFQVYLPVDRTVVSSDSLAPAEDGILGGSETILLAEDDKALRSVTRRRLEMLGYKVLDAPSGEAALEIYQTHSNAIDILLTDLIMPGIKGTELHARLGELNGSLKVIFMSGYSDDDLEQILSEKPSSDFLRKPVSLEKLSETLRKILDAPVA